MQPQQPAHCELLHGDYFFFFYQGGTKVCVLWAFWTSARQLKVRDCSPSGWNNHWWTKAKLASDFSNLIHGFHFLIIICTLLFFVLTNLPHFKYFWVVVPFIFCIDQEYKVTYQQYFTGLLIKYGARATVVYLYAQRYKVFC